jgi:glycosyl transferase family 87
MSVAASEPAPRAGEWRRAADQLVLGIAPIVSVPLIFVTVVPWHNFAVDFHSWYWLAGHRVLHGISPYAVPSPNEFNYPAFGALLFVPFALIPHALAGVLFTVLVLAAVPASLWLLRVRDWRVYGVVMFWLPVIVGYVTANVSLLVLLGLAAIWRYRDRELLAGAVLAVLISVKVFVFPLAIWFLATRRFKAFGQTVLVTAVLNVISWAVLGFHQLPIYVHALKEFTRLNEKLEYSIVGLAMHLGAGQTVGDALGLLLAAAVIGVTLRVHGPDRERIVFTGCVAAGILASPIVEIHYLVLLIAPIALMHPTFSRLWAVPILFIFVPAIHATTSGQIIALALFAMILATTVAGRPQVLART